MKLELKHLAPYLPYSINTNIGKLLGVVNIIEPCCVFKDVFESSHIPVRFIKPILHPLSDYKDINSKSMNELNCDITHQIEINELANKYKNISSLSVAAYQIMCENHIDFNNLIPEGLAIDINTLPQ